MASGLSVITYKKCHMFFFSSLSLSLSLLSFLQVTTLVRDVVSQESNVVIYLFIFFVIMLKEKMQKVMKTIHEVLAEIRGVIKHDKCGIRSNTRLQTKSISHIGLIKIVISA